MFNLTPNRKNFYNMIDDFFNQQLSTFYSFKIDVKDLGNEYVIEADLPGIKKEDIQLEYQDGNLMIVVNQSEEMNEEQEHFIHRERRMSSMRRAIHLENINHDLISAKLDQGVLVIKAPKVENKTTGNQIEIK